MSKIEAMIEKVKALIRRVVLLCGGKGSRKQLACGCQYGKAG